MAGTHLKTQDFKRLMIALVLSLAVHAGLGFVPGGETSFSEPEERHFIEIGIVEAADFVPDLNPTTNLARATGTGRPRAEAESGDRTAPRKLPDRTAEERPEVPAPQPKALKEQNLRKRPAGKKVRIVPEEPLLGSQRRATSEADSSGATEAERSPQASVAESSASSPRVRPRPLSRGNPSPRYPRLALRRGWEGEVVLRVQVSASGDVDRVRVFSSSGYDLLDDSAVEAVRDWRFKPARRGERGVAAIVRVPVRFRLRKG